MKYLLLLSFLLIAASPIPDSPCDGFSFTGHDIGYYFHGEYYMWHGWVTCQVSYETSDGIFTVMEDQVGDYSISGFDKGEITISACQTCAPIDTLWVFLIRTGRVFIPMVLQ